MSPDTNKVVAITPVSIQEKLKENYEMRNLGAFTVYKCRVCGKEIITRSAFPAGVRLVSHMSTHMSIF